MSNNTLFQPAKCFDAPDSTPSDAGVAGTGILLSFMITAGLAILLSISIIVTEFRGNSASIRRKMLDGYSDSQIMQGIGIQSVGLAKMNTLVPYHFFLIWMLSLLSMATHNATLLALKRWHMIIQAVGMFLMAAIAVGAAIRIGTLSQAFGQPSVKLSDEGEKDWSFGQLLSLMLVILPLVSAIEIYRGEMRVEPKHCNVDEGRQRILDKEMQPMS
uniref:Uncharacterized protein n=1 Tax=Bionectria ochroleuca TaxID=29856 RepID=A0A0B7JY10_BIOOC